MWIHSEERPAGEPSVDRALQPIHGLFRVPQQCVNAGNLMVGVVQMAEGSGATQCFSDALQRGVRLVAVGVEEASKAKKERIVLQFFHSRRQLLSGEFQVSIQEGGVRAK